MPSHSSPFFVGPKYNDPQDGATYEQHMIGALNRYDAIGTTPQQPSMNTVYAANQWIGGKNHTSPLRDGGQVVVRDPEKRAGHLRHSKQRTSPQWSNMASNFVGVSLVVLAVGAIISVCSS
jgi:hypothetical protein